MTSIKIVVAYHKPDVLVSDSVLTPVHAGRALARQRMAPDNPDLMWLVENTLGDDTGDNISEKNSSYNEMTTHYWAWKNYAELGDPDYIGFMHYRRHFMFKDGEKLQYEATNLGEPDYFTETLGYSPEAVEQLLTECDFVYTRPHRRTSMWDHYRNNHHVGDLETAVEILEERFPDMKKSAHRYLNGKRAIFCNMFIMPKDLFFEYANFVFTILAELEERVDLGTRRMFVSEWLSGIFITELLARGYNGKQLPMVVSEGPHSVPIALAASPSYVLPLSVTMTSIVENAKQNTSYDFYVLVSEEYPEDITAKLRSLIDRYPGTTITFIPVGERFSDITVATEHIQVHTYFRLLLPSLLPDLKRCIYLDTDIVVEQDLTPMLRWVVDDKYLAGVAAAGYRVRSDEQAQAIGLPSYDRYLNAGSLLMNLDKIRADGLEAVFMDLATKDFESDDQDVLNVACYDGIRVLPFKFNVMTKYNPANQDEFFAYRGVKQTWSEAEWAQGVESPVVIHYADTRKPWLDTSADFSDRWWHYAMLSPMREEIIDQFLTSAMAAGAQKSITLRSALIKERRGDSGSESDFSRMQIRRNVISAARMDLKIQKLRQRLDETTAELEQLRSSRSYKVGRAIVAAPRKLRAAASPAPAPAPKKAAAPAGGKGAAPSGSAGPAAVAKAAPAPEPSSAARLKGAAAKYVPSSMRQANALAQRQEQLLAQLVARQADLSKRLTRMEKSSETLPKALVDSESRIVSSVVETGGRVSRSVGDVHARASEALRASSESVWSAVFHDTVRDSAWFTDQTLSPGRWALGYPALYALYRVLDEMRPTSILELGLGQSTKVISQYVAHAGDVAHTVVEHDQQWVDFFTEGFTVADATRIELLDLQRERHREDPSVLRYAGFKEAIGTTTYDLVVIDGPFGGDAKVYSRIDVLDLIPESLQSRFVILLDDYNRQGEQRTAAEIGAALDEAGVAHAEASYSGAKATWLATSPDLAFFGSL
ncbi:DUF4422 domain-containing protein [Nocardioides sp.]|uniref:DUF4422 domain-containing protein n=1 Tax=Nocardioides sp. TaxID=35761 RepID=UPI0026379C29|nr:DUF4422 domain-containing protein [Nocardioides sp.]